MTMKRTVPVQPVDVAFAVEPVPMDQMLALRPFTVILQVMTATGVNVYFLDDNGARALAQQLGLVSGGLGATGVLQLQKPGGDS